MPVTDRGVRVTVVRTLVLSAPPAVPPLLARGALSAPFRRPRPDAGVPGVRLLLPGARADAARLAAYERVCGLPAGADTLPPAYPHVLAFPLALRLMSGRGFPLPLPGLVHTSITLTRRTGLPAGGAYDLAVWAEGPTPHRRGTEVTVVTEMRRPGADGADPVWESRSTYLARHRVADRPPGPRPAEEPALPVRAEWRLPADLGRRYGAASGDRNPIHLSRLTARPFGFPHAVAHGMWTVARCLAEHGAPEAATVHARFRAPVPLPGTVVYTADGGRIALRAGSGAHATHLTATVTPA